MERAKKFPVAVLDACVLVPMPVADTLLRMAEPPALYEVRWTEEILTEVTRTLVVRFAKSKEKALYREAAMPEFFPSSMVQNYEPLVSRMTNHPKDRHVLAAAAACQADYLVTYNLKDFPALSAEPYGVTIIGPSEFLRQLARIDRKLLEQRLREQAAAINVSVGELLDRLAGAVPSFVSLLQTSRSGKKGR